MESYVEFLLTSESAFDMVIISRELGLEPSEYYCKGDFVRAGAALRSHSAWILSRKSKDNLDLSLPLEGLLDLLMPLKDKILDLCSRYTLETEFSFVIFQKNDSFPVAHISSEFISKISQMNACIDMDIYS